jgi:hypothetical protein
MFYSKPASNVSSTCRDDSDSYIKTPWFMVSQYKLRHEADKSDVVLMGKWSLRAFEVALMIFLSHVVYSNG